MKPSTDPTKTIAASQPVLDRKTTEQGNLKPQLVPKISLHPSNPRQKQRLTDSPLDNGPFNSDDENSSLDYFSPWAHKANNHPQPSPNINIDRNNSNNNNNSPLATIDVPCNQAMEQVGPTAYRIPPSVFARTTSGQPTDWSVASNESLFSIHGATSFKNDDGHMYWRSEDELVGGPPEAEGRESMSADRIFSYPAGQPRGGEAMMRSRELGLAEATMKEVIQESESHQHYVATLAETRASSRRSGTSTKSFAFSIKVGDSPKDGSSRTHSSVRSVTEEHPQPQPQLVLPKADDRSPPQPSTSNEPRVNPARPLSSTRSRWLSCFSCCSIW